MNRIIYVDVLVFLNTIITFILLLADSRIMKISSSPLRYAAGSLVGGLFSLVIFAPDMGFFLSLVTKLLFSVIIVVTAFRIHSLVMIIRAAGYFFAVSFAFAGVMMFIAAMPEVSAVDYNNGTVYIDFSFLSLVAACVICYGVIWLLTRIIKPGQTGETVRSALIIHSGRKTAVTALLDTGSSLTDPFTGESVIVSDRYTLKNILPENINNYFDRREDVSAIKLIPCSTVSSETLMPCFRAERIILEGEKETRVLEDILLAVSSKKLSYVIIPMALYKNSERSRENAKTGR